MRFTSHSSHLTSYTLLHLVVVGLYFSFLFFFCSVSSLYFLQVSACVVYCCVSPGSIQGAVTRLQEKYRGPLQAQSCLCVETSWPQQDTFFFLPLSLIYSLLLLRIRTPPFWNTNKGFQQFTNISVCTLAMRTYLTRKSKLNCAWRLMVHVVRFKWREKATVWT